MESVQNPKKNYFLNICTFSLHFIFYEDNDLLNPIKIIYWLSLEHELQDTRKLMFSFEINAFIFCVLWKNAFYVDVRTAGEL
jgi:hypothetical protein